MIKRITEAGIVEKVFNRDEIIDYLCDDGCQGERDYQIHDSIYYLGWYDEGLKGVAMLYPHNTVTYDSHIAFIGGYSPDKTRFAAKKMIEWMKDKTPCQKIVCAVPQSNKHVIRFVQDIGYNLEGCSPSSFMKNGKLIDRIFYGLEL